MSELVGLPAGSFRLDGKTALVTGVGPGIGANVSLGFAQVGADVVMVARNGERLERLAEEIRAAVPDRRIATIVADVGDAADVDRMVETALNECGPIQVLVNSASDGAHAAGLGVEHQTDELWDASYRVNLLAPLRLVRAFAPGMVQSGGGSVINVLSGSGLQPHVKEGRAAYGTMKAALWMQTRYLAADLAPDIRVNGLVPGSIAPDGGELFDIHHERIKVIPFGRVGRSSELVGAAVYLASSASSYTTGAMIICNGARPW